MKSQNLKETIHQRTKYYDSYLRNNMQELPKFNLKWIDIDHPDFAALFGAGYGDEGDSTDIPPGATLVR